MAKSDRENRGGDRVITALPVYLEGVKGVTRDVSASGLYFETEASFSVGNSVSFTVDFMSRTGKMKLQCRGNIIRVEPNGGRVGVAVKITESTMGAVA